MKKFSKILLGTAAGLGILGCGFTVAGAAMGASVEDMKYEGSSMQKAVNSMVKMVDHWDAGQAVLRSGLCRRRHVPQSAG